MAVSLVKGEYMTNSSNNLKESQGSVHQDSTDRSEESHSHNNNESEEEEEEESKSYTHQNHEEED